MQFPAHRTRTAAFFKALLLVGSFALGGSLSAQLMQGALAPGNQIICPGGDPLIITFSALPDKSKSPSYAWRYKDGIHALPSTATDNTWTTIPGATAISYDPPSGLSASRSYFCAVTFPMSFGQTVVLCSEGVRQVTVSNSVTAFHPGAISSGFAMEVSCTNNIVLAPITFTQSPTAVPPAFNYQWYRTAGTAAAPSGSSKVGWTTIPNATTNALSPAFQGMGPQTVACFVTAPASGCPGAWATGAGTINGTAASKGSVASKRVGTAFPADPAPMAFATAPSSLGSYTYQWYFKDGDNAQPTGSTAGWSLINAATASTYDPPAGLPGPRTYACYLTPGAGSTCGQAGWAPGVVQIVRVSYGTITTGVERICSGAAPTTTLTFLQQPAGYPGFEYKWYVKSGTVSPTEVVPNGNFSGWTITNGPGTSTQSYKPAQGRTTTASYKCSITPAGLQASQGGWAEGVFTVEMLPLVLGTVPAGNQTIASGQVPAGFRLDPAPSGSTAFTYDWYFKEGIVAAPNGASLTGWTKAPRTSTTDMKSNGIFTPPALTRSRTYACFVTPVGTPICGAADWAVGARQITVPGP